MKAALNKKWLSDKDYDFIYSRVPRLCVDLAIKSKKGVLLTKRLIEPYKNTWHMPGGRVKFRESLADAIQRIAQDELGTKVVIKKCWVIWSFRMRFRMANLAIHLALFGW